MFTDLYILPRQQTRDLLFDFKIEPLPLIPHPDQCNIMPFIAELLLPVFDI